MDGLLGLQHVAVNVTDLAAARAFYVDALGLVELDRPNFGFPGLWLGLPDGRAVHLLETAHEPHGGYHFALDVIDVDAVVAHLREVGIAVPEAFELTPGAGRQAFLKDPSGNVIELNQPTR